MDIQEIILVAFYAMTIVVMGVFMVFVLKELLFDMLVPELKNLIAQSQHRLFVSKTKGLGLPLSGIRNLNRTYMLKVYPELTKRGKKKTISYLEAIKIVNKLETVAKLNKITTSDLCETLETLDGNRSLNIDEVAILLSKGIDKVTLSSKARRGYSFQQIIDSNGLPIEWADRLYLNKI